MTDDHLAVERIEITLTHADGSLTVVSADKPVRPVLDLAAAPPFRDHIRSDLRYLAAIPVPEFPRVMIEFEADGRHPISYERMASGVAAARGRFRLTVRPERADGQFTTSTTTVPGDLLDDTDQWHHIRFGLAREKAGDGFSEAYRRLAELPE
jgi:hypothetical protein